MLRNEICCYHLLVGLLIFVVIMISIANCLLPPGTREGHIDRLLTSGSTEGTLIDSEIDSSIENSLANTVIRHVAPHLQAVSAGELVQLLQADQLSRETEELTDSATSSSSETLPSSR